MPKARTTKTKVPAPKPHARRDSQVSTTRLPVDGVVAQLVRDLEQRVKAMTPSPKQRQILTELRTYGRAIDRWLTVEPTEAQRAALFEQLLALEERTRGRRSSRPVRARSEPPAESRADADGERAPKTTMRRTKPPPVDEPELPATTTKKLKAPRL